MNWLHLVEILTPVVLQYAFAGNPHAQALVPIVRAGIAEANGIKGATGPQKLLHVTNLVILGAEGVNVEQGHEVLNVEAVTNTIGDAISAIVNAANIVHKAQVAAEVTPVPPAA